MDWFERLRQDDATRSWFDHVDRLGEPVNELVLPSVEALPSVLLDLAVPHEDIDDLARYRPSPGRTPELWWLLEKATQSLTSNLGAIDRPPPFPPLPIDAPVPSRLFYVYMLVAAAPAIYAFNRSKGIPDAITRATLRDMGRTMAEHWRRFGTGGLEGSLWPTMHFRGVNYELGRLQFERMRLAERDAAAIAATGEPGVTGAHALSIHIPSFFGPMTPSSCSNSIAWAQHFFPKHFPEERYQVAICFSWLLDPQLQEYLPPSSNIVQFQRRFRYLYSSDDPSDDILRFVHGRFDGDLDRLPQRSTLEKAIVTHLKRGESWRLGVGWFPLVPDRSF